jgi:hypothetical protein
MAVAVAGGVEVVVSHTFPTTLFRRCNICGYFSTSAKPVLFVLAHAVRLRFMDQFPI